MVQKQKNVLKTCRNFEVNFGGILNQKVTQKQSFSMNSLKILRKFVEDSSFFRKYWKNRRKFIEIHWKFTKIRRKFFEILRIQSKILRKNFENSSKLPEIRRKFFEISRKFIEILRNSSINSSKIRRRFFENQSKFRRRFVEIIRDFSKILRKFLGIL